MAFVINYYLDVHSGWEQEKVSVDSRSMQSALMAHMDSYQFGLGTSPYEYRTVDCVRKKLFQVESLINHNTNGLSINGYGNYVLQKMWNTTINQVGMSLIILCRVPRVL